MKTKKVIPTVTMALCLVCLVFQPGLDAAFSSKDAGTAGAQFLKIGVGARPVGLGEAYAAVSDDIYSIYWNPAGLGQVKVKEVGLSYSMWIEKTNYNFVAYAHPTKMGTFALAINQLSMPPIEKVDNTGNTDGTTYTASDMAVNLGYGAGIKNIYSGLTVKLVQSTIDSVSASAFAVDLGVLYSQEKFSFSAGIQNLGSKIKFIAQEDSLPMNIKVGTAMKLIPGKMLVAMDINAPSDNEIRLNLGTEYVKRFSDAFSMSGRLGAKTNVKGLEPMSAISAGFGINWTMLNFDVVWVPYGNLGDTIRVSLGARFGSTGSETTVTVPKGQGGPSDNKKDKFSR